MSAKPPKFRLYFLSRQWHHLCFVEVLNSFEFDLRQTVEVVTCNQTLSINLPRRLIPSSHSTRFWTFTSPPTREMLQT